MAQYKEGTVTVTNASQTVTGDSTEWLANVSVGDLFTVIGSGVPYFVGAVVSDTEITLSANYAGATQSGETYVVARDFEPLYDFPIPNRKDIEATTIVRASIIKIAEEIAAIQSQIDLL